MTRLYHSYHDDEGINIDLAEALQQFHQEVCRIEGGYTSEEIWARLTEEQFLLFVLKYPQFKELFKNEN